MNPAPKQKRIIDKKYLAWIKTQPCLVSDFDCRGDVVYHHTVTVGAGGSDYDTVPLCSRHHILGVHSMGCQTFQDVYEIDFEVEIKRLNKKYKNKDL